MDLEKGHPEELWQEVITTRTKKARAHVPKAKKISKREWLSEEAIEVANQRRIVQSNKDFEETRILNADFQRKARKDKEECCITFAKKLGKI